MGLAFLFQFVFEKTLRNKYRKGAQGSRKGSLGSEQSNLAKLCKPWRYKKNEI
jgi:hypothetical protein